MQIHRRLMGLASAVHGFFPVTALTSFMIAVAVIAQMYLLSTIISRIFISSETPAPPVFILLAASITVRGILVWIRERHAQQQTVQIKSSIRRDLYAGILKSGPLTSRTGRHGELIASITDGVEKLDDYFTRYIPSLVHTAILPPAIIIFTLGLDWISGLLLLLTAPLIIFFMWLIGTYARKLTQNQWSALSTLSSHFLDVLLGLKTLKIFGAGKKEAAGVIENSDRFRQVTMSVLKVAFLSAFVLELAASISIALVALQVGIRLIEGMISYDQGLFILLLAPEFYMPFRVLGQHHHAGMEGTAAAAAIFDIKDRTGSPCDISRKPAILPGRQEIEFRGAGYTYPGSPAPALREINCLLRPDTITAVAGPSGSGKTTLAFILLGFLQPESGQVLVNGKPLEPADIERWRELVAYVPQHPHFFNGTILDNLLMADSRAEMKKVATAVKRAGAHHFIEQLPEGYNTMLSDNAARLSSGERQRLAVARAFLKDSPVLVLDEPTSNLDPESEQYISSATQELAEGRTTLIIAHRLKTVRRATNILVLDRGRIAESGNHNELLVKKGIYHGFLERLGLQNGSAP